MLIAVSGTLNVSGSGQVLANGGRGGRIGAISSDNLGAVGGGGSGGGIRLVATTITGAGVISAMGGARGGYSNEGSSLAAFAGAGRIRLEAEFMQRGTPSTPNYTSGLPGPLFLIGLPSLRISRVGGINAPAAPTGYADVVLPTNAPNPVELVLATRNVPLGNTLSIIVTPPSGVPQTVVSGAIAGSLENGTAVANVDIPIGPSVLLATLTYSVSGAQAQQLSLYTGGEPVVQVELAAQLGAGPGMVTLITEAGRRFEVAASAL
ncbi:hypothetical protein [Aquimonas sp.]|uniref:hypothetical protein n=1 Tax=Aquimonas sp. TaxID=1872588 RepID=UPI0037C08452